jgi:hypothetical protein
MPRLPYRRIPGKSKEADETGRVIGLLFSVMSGCIGGMNQGQKII